MALFAPDLVFPAPKGRKLNQIWRSQELDPAVPEAKIFSFMNQQSLLLFFLLLLELRFPSHTMETL